MFEFLTKLFRGQRTPARRRCGDYSDPFDQLVAGVRDYAIFLLDAQGTVMTWNAGAERIKGYHAAEIIGQNFSRFYPPDAIAAGWPAHELAEAAAVGRFEDEGWRLRKDGSHFWANVVITTLRNADGSPRGFLKITRDLTERKQAEENARRLAEEQAARRAAEADTAEALRLQQEERRQREQLRVTLTSIGDAVIVTDHQGVVTFLNPAAEAVTGWTPQEARGQPVDRVFPIVHEHTRQPVENPVSRAIREGDVGGLANHTLLIRRDGREVPIDDSAAPIRGEDGAVAGVVLVFRDVTERRQAIQTRLHLAAIVESSEDAIISKNLDGIITSWNRAAERLYGYAAAEVIGRPLAMLVPPDHADELPGIMARIRRGERVEHVEHVETVRVRKDGRPLNVALTISPVRTADGTITGASKIARDITAAKRHEESLRFLAQASSALADVLDISSTLHKVAGLAVPSFADWCAVDLAGPDDVPRRVAVAHADPAKVRFAHELYRRFPPDPASPVGVWNVLRTGQSELVPELPPELLQKLVKDEELLNIVRELGLKSYMAVALTIRGRSFGVLTFVAAESRRSFDADDLRVAEDLANRAAIAIENARLYDELKEADRRKDEWIAMLAHELRNPLAPIRNALHIMKVAGSNGAAVSTALQMTERQVQHLIRLVDDLLDVSRIMRGRIELRKEPIELADAITRGTETAQPTIDVQGQKLIVDIPPGSLRLEADPIRLAQVIANLLHNAAKFSERGGRIWLTAERQGNEAVVRIRDEGVGIRPELLARIFELFVQGESTLERSHGGLGIGLTVVRRLVELHGGTITAHSDGPGRGSEFVVRLPGLEKSS